MAQRIYTASEAATIAGVPFPTLDYWVRTNLVTPSVAAAHGSGTRRIFSLDDLVQLRFIRRLRSDKWSLQKIRIAVETLRKIMDHPNPLHHAVVIGSRKTILALVKTAEGERIVIDTLQVGGQQVMTIILEELRAEIQEAIEQYSV